MVRLRRLRRDLAVRGGAGAGFDAELDAGLGPAPRVATVTAAEPIVSAVVRIKAGKKITKNKLMGKPTNITTANA
jgi:hypothetical protein